MTTGRINQVSTLDFWRVLSSVLSSGFIRVGGFINCFLFNSWWFRKGEPYSFPSLDWIKSKTMESLPPQKTQPKGTLLFPPHSSKFFRFSINPGNLHFPSISILCFHNQQTILRSIAGAKCKEPSLLRKRLCCLPLKTRENAIFLQDLVYSWSLIATWLFHPTSDHQQHQTFFHLVFTHPFQPSIWYPVSLIPTALSFLQIISLDQNSKRFPHGTLPLMLSQSKNQETHLKIQIQKRPSEPQKTRQQIQARKKQINAQMASSFFAIFKSQMPESRSIDSKRRQSHTNLPPK